MRTPVARWNLLSKSSTTPRSSHCLSISKDGLLAVYGGELMPRTPTDARLGPTDASKEPEALSGSVHVLDLRLRLASPHSPVKNFETISPSKRSCPSALIEFLQ